jgi:ADP-ribose pyrophosphatase YjhB (NUDIX family)
MAYRAVKHWEEVEILIHKGEVRSVFAGCIVYTPAGQIFLIKEEKKQHFRFPGGGMHLGVEGVKQGLAREVAEEAEHRIDESALEFIVGFLTEDDTRSGLHLRVFFSYPIFSKWERLTDGELQKIRSPHTEKVEHWGLVVPRMHQSAEPDERTYIEFYEEKFKPPYNEKLWVSGFHLRALRRYMWNRPELFEFVEDKELEEAIA